MLLYAFLPGWRHGWRLDPTHRLESGFFSVSTHSLEDALFASIMILAVALLAVWRSNRKAWLLVLSWPLCILYLAFAQWHFRHVSNHSWALNVSLNRWKTSWRIVAWI